jgi:hypothetical protein
MKLANWTFSRFGVVTIKLSFKNSFERRSAIRWRNSSNWSNLPILTAWEKRRLPKPNRPKSSDVDLSNTFIVSWVDSQGMCCG